MAGMESYLKYFTEEDWIDRYTEKRKITGIPREDIEDLYKAIKLFVLYKLEDTQSSSMGFHLNRVGSFIHRKLKLDNLKKGIDSPHYKRAEKQLHYYLNNHNSLKME